MSPILLINRISLKGIEVGESDILIKGDTVVQLTGFNSGFIPAASYKASVKTDCDKTAGTEGKTERRSLTRNMQLVVELGEILKAKFSLHDMCDRVLEFLLKNLPRIDRATIALFDPDSLTIITALSKTRSGQKDVMPPYSRQVLEKTLRTGKSVRMSNTYYETEGELSESIEALKIKSLMCVPMISNNKVRGVIYVESLTKPYAFRKEDMMLLNGLSGPIAVAVENALLTAHSD